VVRSKTLLRLGRALLPQNEKPEAFATTAAGLIELGAWLEETAARTWQWKRLVCTGSWYGMLADGSFELILANAAHVRNVPGRTQSIAKSGKREITAKRRLLTRQPHAPLPHVLEHKIHFGRAEGVFEGIVLRARRQFEIGTNRGIA